MVIPKKTLTLMALLCAGLILAMTSIAGAAIKISTLSYDTLMQTELDSLLDQAAGQFENTGDYLEKSEFYAVFAKGLKGKGSIKQYYEKAIEAQRQADTYKDNPELQDIASIAMDDLFLSILYQVQLNKALASKDQGITQLLIDILEGRGEGFSEDPRPALPELGIREGDDLLPEPDEDPDPKPNPETGFLFYGKAYNLDTDIDLSKSTNGILYFTDDPFKVTITFPEQPEPIMGDDDLGYGDDLDFNGGLPSVSFSYPAAAMPFLFHALPDIGEGFDLEDYIAALGEDFIVTVTLGDEVIVLDAADIGGFLDAIMDDDLPPRLELTIEYVPQDIFEAPDDPIKNQDFYRYTWDTLFEEDQDDYMTGDYARPTDGPEKIPPFSVTLYKNDWISYVYSDLSNVLNDPEMPSHLIFTGLTPGDGSAGHPGEGLPRGLVARLYECYGKLIDISEETGVSFFSDGDGFDDFLIQLGSDTPSSIWDYIQIIGEDDEPGPGHEYLTIGEAFLYLNPEEMGLISELLG
ncbi:MAG: hypothetical protein DRH93_14285, partial [Deltaproteobacteria bacterium]